MVNVAKVSDVPPDSVRIDLQDGINLGNDGTLDKVVRLVMQGLGACDEPDAQMGVFTDERKP
jgi:hypothetical protein